MTTALAPATGTQPALAAAAAVTGVAAIAQAIYQVATPDRPHATFGSVSDWFRDGDFLLYLVAAIVAVTMSRRTGLVDAVPSWLVRVGYGLIAIGAAYGLIAQDDPDWFFLLAGPGLLASSLGHVWWAVVAVRRRLMPLWSGLLLGVGGLLAVIASELGTSVLIGAFWLWMAWDHRA